MRPLDGISPWVMRIEGGIQYKAKKRENGV